MNATNPPEAPTASKRERFKAVYTAELRNAVLNHPTEYCWPVANVEVVASRMFEAMDRGTFNHSSYAYRQTAKALGIKPTRTAILAYWKGTL